MRWASCAECGTPCGLYSTGWYRCRQCGHESLRDSQPYDRLEASYVAASIAEETRVRDGGEAAAALGLSPYSISDK